MNCYKSCVNVSKQPNLKPFTDGELALKALSRSLSAIVAYAMRVTGDCTKRIFKMSLRQLLPIFYVLSVGSMTFHSLKPEPLVLQRLPLPSSPTVSNSG